MQRKSITKNLTRSNAALFGMIVAVPFMVLSSKSIYEAHQVAFAVASLVLISALIKNRSISIFGYYVAGYVALDFIRSILHMVRPAYPYSSLGDLMFIILGMLFIYAIMESSADTDFFMNAVCILAVSQMVLATIQGIFGVDLFSRAIDLVTPTQSTLPKNAAMGTFGNNNFLSGYLAIAFPFFLRKKWVYALPLLILTLLLAKTSTAIAAFSCSAAYYLWGNRKLRWYLPAAIVLGAFAYVLLSEGGMGQTIFHNLRWSFWVEATDRWFSGGIVSIIFGLGLGADTGFRFPLHNEWIQTSFHLGILGMGMVLWFFISTRTNNRLLNASVVAIAVDCLGNHPIHMIPSAMLILVVVALIARDGLEKVTA